MSVQGIPLSSPALDLKFVLESSGLIFNDHLLSPETPYYLFHYIQFIQNSLASDPVASLLFSVLPFSVLDVLILTSEHFLSINYNCTIFFTSPFPIHSFFMTFFHAWVYFNIPLCLQFLLILNQYLTLNSVSF